jgi:hypothetical protein
MGEEPPIQRRLAAILADDIAGYSRLRATASAALKAVGFKDVDCS